MSFSATPTQAFPLVLLYEISKSLPIDFANHLLKSSLSPCKTAWTGFDPHLYSGGSSSAGTALVESGNCKVSFTLNRGIVTEATPWSQDGVPCIPHYLFLAKA